MGRSIQQSTPQGDFANPHMTQGISTERSSKSLGNDFCVTMYIGKNGVDCGLPMLVARKEVKAGKQLDQFRGARLGGSVGAFDFLRSGRGEPPTTNGD